MSDAPLHTKTKVREAKPGQVLLVIKPVFRTFRHGLRTAGHFFRTRRQKPQAVQHGLCTGRYKASTDGGPARYAIGKRLRGLLLTALLLALHLSGQAAAAPSVYGNYVDDSLFLHLNDRAFAFKDYSDDAAYEQMFARYQQRLRELKVGKSRFYASYLFLVSYYIENKHYHKASSTALHVMGEISKLHLKDAGSVGYAIMGRIYNSRGENAKAISMMQKAVKEDTRHDPTLTSFLLLEASRIAAPTRPLEARDYALEALKYCRTRTRRLYTFIAVAVTAYYLDDQSLYEQMQDSVNNYHRRWPNDKQLWPNAWEPLMRVFHAYFKEGPQQAIKEIEGLPVNIYDMDIAIHIYRRTNEREKLDKMLQQQSEVRDSLHDIVYEDYLTGISRDYNLFLKQQNTEHRNLIFILVVLIITIIAITVALIMLFIHLRRQSAALIAAGAAAGSDRPDAAPEASPSAGESHGEEGEGEELPDVQSADRQLYSRIVQYINANHLYLNPGLQREDILKELHISKNKFTELFRICGHTTFLRYVNHLRMEYALSLLRNYPGYTIEAVALESGINPKNFYSIFLKKYGITPTEYKRRVREERQQEAADTPHEE